MISIPKIGQRVRFISQPTLTGTIVHFVDENVVSVQLDGDVASPLDVALSRIQVA